jgi:dolichyl-phosphate beta-glucosyltransferase
MKSCTVVVPCYNEAERLNQDAFKAYLAGHGSASLLFVNDGSTDETLNVLQRLVGEMPGRACLLNHQPNSGKAEAVRQGMIHALKDPEVQYIGFWDADLATPLDAIADLKEVLDHNPNQEMVFGSRVRLMGRRIQRKATRHYFGRIFASCVSIILDMPIYDTQCGAKLFRATPTLLRVLDRPFLSKWIFDVEIIARFIQLRPRKAEMSDVIYELPLRHWKDISGSKLKLRDFLKAVYELWNIRKAYLLK